VVGFFEVISTSAPHIYHSALPLSPRESIVHGLYKAYVRPLARIVRGLPISWEPVVATMRHGHSVHAAAWSPCSRFIAVGLPEMIEILDAVTLERLHTFTHPWTMATRWISFSPDSRSLTQFGGGDYGIVTWDVQTGRQISATSTPNTPSSRYLSSTYSMDGKVVAVTHSDLDKTAVTVVSTYNLLSGTHIYSHRVSEGRIVASIWTHGESLRFVTVKPGSITIWEVGFTSKHTLAEVESLPAPDGIGSEESLFLPTRSRLAFILQEAVLVWDARDSKLLLNFVGGDQPMGLSFSSDGRFFACETIVQGIHLWKESPTGYLLHRKLTSGTGIAPLLSPNGESIITSQSSVTRLWYTTDPTNSPSSVPTHTANRTDLILGFSPDKSLAVAARLGDNMATIIDLESSDPCLIIDAGMKICGLGVAGNTVIVVGEGKIVTWDLPAGYRVLDAKANIDDSVHTTVFSHLAPPPERLHSASISLDFNCIAITRGYGEGLDFYDMSTGEHLVGTTARDRSRPWFTRDGHEVWSSLGLSMEGWKIIRDGKSGAIGLEPLAPDADPSEGYPWESPHGHDVTADGWVLGSGGRRLMWLPHHWRNDECYRVWDGRFLGVFDHGLPEPVIVELDD
jgi:WD40 repeat protein